MAGRSIAEIRTYRSGAHEVEWQKYRGSVGKNSQVALLDADSVRLVVGGLIGCFPDRRQSDEPGACGDSRIPLIAGGVQIGGRRPPLRHVAAVDEVIAACTAPNIEPFCL